MRPCLRALSVGSGGFVGDSNFDASNFPPAGSVLVPKGAGIRTTDLDRTREAFSGVLQYERPDRGFRRHLSMAARRGQLRHRGIRAYFAGG